MEHQNLHHQAKRMRLGTKSCTECRRRKVRCTFNDGSDSCRQCVIHNIQCRSQDDGANSASACPSVSVSSHPVPASEDLQARIGSLEASVQLLCRTISQNGINHGSFPIATRGANSFGAFTTGCCRRGGVECEQRIEASEDTPLDEAPLVQYLRGSLASQPDATLCRQVERSTPRLPGSRVQGLIPTNSTLVHMFEFTKQFWEIWPLYLPGVCEEENIHSIPTSVPNAIVFVDESLRSPNPSIVAKCLVWLCLCLQQLPQGFTTSDEFRLPMPKAELTGRYLEEVEGLVFRCSTSRLACELDLLEVYILQCELFINMGRPCRAWRSVRQGVSSAMLLGLHRPGQQDYRKREIWSTFWTQDRQLSVFLGLPYTVPEQLLPRNERDDSSRTLEQKILRQVAVVCGKIVDRDQQQQQQQQKESSYSTTVCIMQDIDRLKRMIPATWWRLDEDPDSSTTLGILFWRRAILLYFHFVNKLLHLPYVNLASRDRMYEHSRSLVFESAEAMVLTYLSLRKLVDDTFSCDFLDFVAFSAAMVIATDLITQGSLRSPADTKRLWELLQELSQRMRRTSEELDCSVAMQSYEVLEYLYRVRHGMYDGPDQYEIIIPYFGRMRIRRPAESCNLWTLKPVPSVSGSSEEVVDFTADFFSFRFPSEFQTAEELGEDWSELVHTDTWDDVLDIHDSSI